MPDKVIDPITGEECEVISYDPEFPSFYDEKDWKLTTVSVPEYSNWQCWLFGSTDGSGFIWRPEKGKEPNWFWKKMQYLFFGNRWEYNPKDKS